MNRLLLTLEYPPNIGGIATYYFNIAKKFKIEVMHLQEGGRLSWIKFFKPVRRQLCHSEPERRISELQVGQVLPLGYIAILCRILYKTPYIVYVHGLDVLQPLSIWKKFWIKIILMFSRQVITNSKYVKDKTGEKYNISYDKIAVQYPLLDVKKIESLGGETEKRSEKVILSVGRLVKRKGFDKVIQALRFFAAAQDHIIYQIIGKGPDRARLESLVKKYNLSNRVKFLGAIKSPEIYHYYKNCDLFIMPAREIDGDVEGFGIVFLEAGIFKKPVIGGRSGGVSEAIVDKQTGLLVDGENVEEIAEAMSLILNNKQLAAELGNVGYKRVVDEFNL